MANIQIDTGIHIHKLIKKLIPMTRTENSGLNCIPLHAYI